MRIQVLVAAAICAAIPCESPGGEPVAKIVAPYLDDQTVAIAHLDLAGIDVDAAVERIATATGIDAKMLADPRRSIREGLAMFRKAGATDLYAVLSLADLPNPGPFLLAPRAGVNDDELKTALSFMRGGQTVEPLDGVMFAGSKSARDRLRTLKPAPRPDLETAWQSVAGSPMQIAFIPGEDHRRVFTEMIPTLPKEIGGGPGTILTKGVRWAALGIDLKPKIVVKLVVQSEDAAAAKALAQVVDHGLETVSHDQAARTMFPKLDEMVAAVRPKVTDDRLTIAVDDSAPGVAAAAAGLVGQARSNAGRTMSMNNLKQLALAWHIYADPHMGAFPGQHQIQRRQAALELASRHPALHRAERVVPAVQARRTVGQRTQQNADREDAGAISQPGSKGRRRQDDLFGPDRHGG